MKGLILGNSHVSAIKDSQPAVPGLDLHYYAVLSGAGPKLDLRGDRLWPVNPENTVLTDIPEAETLGLDPRPYDFVAFCSLGVGAARPEYPDHTLRRFGLAGLMVPSTEPIMPLSQRLFLDHLLTSHIDSLGAGRTLAMLRQIYAGPLIVAPMPLPCVGLFPADHPLSQTYGDRVRDFVSLVGQQVLAHMRAMAEADPALKALDYPDPAWLSQGSTPDSFVNRPTDPWHMNAAYGALVFDQIRQAAGIG